MYSFSYLEPVCFSKSSSNGSFLTCIQISQQAGRQVRHSHLLKSFPDFVVVHTVKGFGVVNKTEIDVWFFFFPFWMGILFILFFFYFSFIFISWRLITLKYCSSFCHTCFLFIFISWRPITLQYCSGFCHTLT